MAAKWHARLQTGAPIDGEQRIDIQTESYRQKNLLIDRQREGRRTTDRGGTERERRGQ